jgi:hypothetical protein
MRISAGSRGLSRNGGISTSIARFRQQAGADHIAHKSFGFFSPYLSAASKRRLKMEYCSLHLAELKRQIECLQKQFLSGQPR